MAISQLFNKKNIAIAVLAAMALPTWTSFQHDRKIHGDFRSQANRDLSEKTITIETDGVTRQGYLNKGAAMPVLTFGFYNHPSAALAVAQTKEAACWYTNLRVTKGQENLPLWQKIFGGAEYERIFSNQSFSSLGYTCAPMQDGTTIENVSQPTLQPAP